MAIELDMQVEFDAVKSKNWTRHTSILFPLPRKASRRTNRSKKNAPKLWSKQRKDVIILYDSDDDTAPKKDKHKTKPKRADIEVINLDSDDESMAKDPPVMVINKPRAYVSKGPREAVPKGSHASLVESKRKPVTKNPSASVSVVPSNSDVSMAIDVEAAPSAPGYPDWMLRSIEGLLEPNCEKPNEKRSFDDMFLDDLEPGTSQEDQSEAHKDWEIASPADNDLLPGFIIPSIFDHDPFTKPSELAEIELEFNNFECSDIEDSDKIDLLDDIHGIGLLDEIHGTDQIEGEKQDESDATIDADELEGFSEGSSAGTGAVGESCSHSSLPASPISQETQNSQMEVDQQHSEDVQFLEEDYGGSTDDEMVMQINCL